MPRFLIWVRNLPLGLRLATAAVVVEVIILSAVSIATLRTIDDRLLREMEQRDATLRLTLEVALAEPLMQKDYSRLADMLSDLKKNQDMQYLALFDADQRLLINRGLTNLTPPSASDCTVLRSLYRNKDYYDCILPVTVMGKLYGHLYYGMSLARIAETRTDLARIQFLSAITIILLSVPLFVTVGVILTRPLRALTKRAEALANGYFDHTPPQCSRRRDEVGRLTEAFHNMALSLQTRLREVEETSEKLHAVADFSFGWEIWLSPTGALLWVNSSVTRMTGYTPEECEAMLAFPHDLIHPKDRPRVASRLATAFITETPNAALDDEVAPSDALAENVEFQVRRKNATTFWASASWQRIQTADGVNLGVRMSIRDVTERAMAERALREAMLQAERANESKSLFLANMSHELRTPLNAIIGFSEIIRDQMFGSLGNSKYVEYASDIYDSGQSLLTLICDILDLSKIEAGRMEIERSWFDLPQLLSNIADEFSAVALTNEHELRFLSTNCPSRFNGDAHAIRQIITNLLSNALKFTPRRGQITVHVTEHNHGDLRLTVADTGVGIPEDMIERVLKPFEQINNRYNKTTGGAGLGLSLVKGLTTLHGGTLTIKSALGIGTSIIVCLPKE
ncbi:hypothetical protein CCP2SC5_20101 [Azospirillaceae bacterium]